MTVGYLNNSNMGNGLHYNFRANTNSTPQNNSAPQNNGLQNKKLALKVDEFVKRVDEEKEKKNHKAAVAVGSGVVGLSLLVAFLNPKFSAKLIENLKVLQAKTGKKIERSKGDFLASKFYKALSKITGKASKFVSYANNFNSVKDTYFKQLCTEEKAFANVKSSRVKNFYLKFDKILRKIFKKPHELLTKWGDSLAKHSVKLKYKRAEKRMNKLDEMLKELRKQVPDNKKAQFDRKLKQLQSERKYFDAANLDERFAHQEDLMSNLNKDIREHWNNYRHGFTNKSVNHSEHFNKNLSFWAQDIMEPARTEINKKGKLAVDKLVGNTEGTKGTYNELMELLEGSLNDGEKSLLRKTYNKAQKGLRTANKSECMSYFDKKRDLVLGSAPTDVATALGGLAFGTVALASAKDKDSRISRGLTGVMPTMGGIATNIAMTSMLFSGPKALIIGSISGGIMSLAGSVIDKYRLKIKYPNADKIQSEVKHA